MPSLQLPKLSSLEKSNLGEDFYHSAIISLLRGVAAIEVCAAHLRAQFFPGFSFIPNPTIWFQGLAFITGFAHQAVVLFFLLSGWLVGGSFLNKMAKPDCLKTYASDRISRLWIVLIPVFLLMLLFGMFTGTLDTRFIDFSTSNDYSITTFIGNLIGLQPHIVPAFGGNFPLWSLSNETWYYILFPMLVFLFKTKNMLTVLAIAIAATLIIALLTYGVLLYFSIWLMGVIFSRIKIDTTRFFQMFFFAVFLMIAIFYRMTGKNDGLDVDSFFQDFIFSLAFLVFLSSTQEKIRLTSRTIAVMRRGAGLLASFSFTLYVLHIPLIGLLLHLFPSLQHNKLAPNSGIDWAIYFLMLGSIIALSYIFHLPFESNTHKLRRLIKNLFSERQKTALSAVSSDDQGR